MESIAGDFTVQPVEVTAEPRAIGPVDAVLVGVKAWQVRETAAAMGPLLGADTFVVPLQNGVEAPDELAAVVGPARVLGGLARILAFVAGPGHIRHTGVVPRIEFGERDGRPSARVAALRAAFAQAEGISVATPDDITAALWEKFLFITPLSAVGAVTRVPAGALRAVPETRRILEQATRELDRRFLASGDALRRLAATERYVLEPLGPRALRGRATPVEVYAVERSGTVSRAG